MDIYRTFLVIALVSMPVGVMADTTLSNKSVRYSGELLAKRVCKSVVRDDAQAVRKIFRGYKRTLPYGYQLSLTGRSIAGNFTCNGQMLKPFSAEIGALDVSYYLSTGQLKNDQPPMISKR